MDKTISKSSSASVIAAGLALFSMFFGAGDLIWPLILGGIVGEGHFFATMGLLITGVSLPLLGVVAMLLFQGNCRAFFQRIGRVPGLILLFIIQAILGPIGSIPRLFTLSYATLKPYLPDISLGVFSILAGAMVFLLAYRKQRIIDILGLVLTPLLLITLGAILFLGLYHPPAALHTDMTPAASFFKGAGVGYNTLDIIASFIFAPLVLSHFQQGDSAHGEKPAIRKMLHASLIAAGLLSVMYIGLTYVSSYYTPLLPAGHAPEERLAAISFYLMGPIGAFCSCIAVAMACLTTAIPLVSICADYIRKDLCKNKIGPVLPALFTLGVSAAIANLGFSGIANMLSPILQILCPGLIVLCILNILYKLYELEFTRAPVYAAFAFTGAGYLLTKIPL
jgi:LIVCS family branched-chain amino acid:cation transporter